MIIRELSQTIMTELILSNEQQTNLCNTSEDAMMSMYTSILHTSISPTQFFQMFGPHAHMHQKQILQAYLPTRQNKRYL